MNAKSLYIPASIPPLQTHLIEKIVGREALEYLVAEFAGTTIAIPRLSCLNVLHRAGVVRNLLRHGVPLPLIAEAVEISPRHVANIRKMLTLEGFAPDLIEPDENS